MQAVPKVWDDPSVDWGEFGAVVLRSTWDYHRRITEFLDWVVRVAQTTTLWNPPELVRWNSHKRYLAELSTHGVDVVPSELIAAGSERTLESVLSSHDWSAVVLKPAVGADGDGLRLVERDGLEAGDRHLRSLLSTGDALVQPLLRRVRTDGERSLVFLDGTFSHALGHPFILDGGSREGHQVLLDEAVVRSVEKAIHCLTERPLYARADLLPSDDGRWLLSELELIEPDLFLRTDTSSPRRFATAIIERLHRDD